MSEGKFRLVFGVEHVFRAVVRQVSSLTTVVLLLTRKPAVENCTASPRFRARYVRARQRFDMYFVLCIYCIANALSLSPPPPPPLFPLFVLTHRDAWVSFQSALESMQRYDPHRMEGLDLLSTTLWHLKREVRDFLFCFRVSTARGMPQTKAHIIFWSVGYKDALSRTASIAL